MLFAVSYAVLCRVSGAVQCTVWCALCAVLWCAVACEVCRSVCPIVWCCVRCPGVGRAVSGAVVGAVLCASPCRCGACGGLCCAECCAGGVSVVYVPCAMCRAITHSLTRAHACAHVCVQARACARMHAHGFMRMYMHTRCGHGEPGPMAVMAASAMVAMAAPCIAAMAVTRAAASQPQLNRSHSHITATAHCSRGHIADAAASQLRSHHMHGRLYDATHSWSHRSISRITTAAAFCVLFFLGRPH